MLSEGRGWEERKTTTLHRGKIKKRRKLAPALRGEFRVEDKVEAKLVLLGSGSTYSLSIWGYVDIVPNIGKHVVRNYVFPFHVHCQQYALPGAGNPLRRLIEIFSSLRQLDRQACGWNRRGGNLPESRKLTTLMLTFETF